MSYRDVAETSGEPVGPIGQGQETGVYTKNTDTQESRSRAYDLFNDQTGRKSSPVNLAPRQEVLERTDEVVQRQIAQREHISRLLRECRVLMEEILETDDPIDLSNGGNRLLQTLDSLWEWRNVREENWGDILNLLQGALKNEQLETFPRQRREAIGRIFEDCLTIRSVTRNDVDRSIQLLKKAGLDPWKGISGSL